MKESSIKAMAYENGGSEERMNRKKGMKVERSVRTRGRRRVERWRRRRKKRGRVSRGRGGKSKNQRTEGEWEGGDRRGRRVGGESREEH